MAAQNGKDLLIKLDMTVEDAAKFIISAGVIIPPDGSKAIGHPVPPPAEAANAARRKQVAAK